MAHFWSGRTINACALWVAATSVGGVTFNGDVPPFLGVALIFV